MKQLFAIVAAIGAGIAVYSCGDKKPIPKPLSVPIASNAQKAARLLKQFERNTWQPTHQPQTVTDFETGQHYSIRVEGNAAIEKPRKRSPLYSASEIAASERRDAQRAKTEGK